MKIGYFIAVAGLTIVGCQPKEIQTEVLSKQSHCGSIQWYGSNLAEPGVFTVEAKISSVEGFEEEGELQVDTGAGFTGLYGTATDWPNFTLKPNDGRTVVMNGIDADHFSGVNIEIAGRAIKADPVVNFFTNNKDKVLGTMGMGSLWGEIVLIDTVDNKFCFMDVGDDRLSAATYTPLKTENGYLLMDLELDNKLLGQAIFDTGSVFTNIRTSNFQAIADSEQDPVIVEVSSWGKMVPLEGYPLKGSLSSGDLDLNIQTVFKEENSVWEASIGTVGMSAFEGQVIILDLRADSLKLGTLDK